MSTASAWASKAARNASSCADVDGQARRGAVAAVAAQVHRPRVQRAEQVKAGDAAARATAGVPVERHQHRGAVVALDDPRGDDPDHPRMPVL